jgi:hypothetical protein
VATEADSTWPCRAELAIWRSRGLGARLLLITLSNQQGCASGTCGQAARKPVREQTACHQPPAGRGIQPGEPADLVICDGDPFAPATQVTQTWVAGTVAWPG